MFLNAIAIQITCPSNGEQEGTKREDVMRHYVTFDTFYSATRRCKVVVNEKRRFKTAYSGNFLIFLVATIFCGLIKCYINYNIMLACKGQIN